LMVSSLSCHVLVSESPARTRGTLPFLGLRLRRSSSNQWFSTYTSWPMRRGLLPASDCPQTQHVARTPLSPPPTLLTSGVALLRTPLVCRSRVVTCCANPVVDADCLQGTGATTSTSLACTACEAMLYCNTCQKGQGPPRLGYAS
jgi:hypothetical protein